MQTILPEARFVNHKLMLVLSASSNIVPPFFLFLTLPLSGGLAMLVVVQDAFDLSLFRASTALHSERNLDLYRALLSVLALPM